MPTDLVLDADNSFTIFLLPFAYNEKKLKPSTSPSSPIEGEGALWKHLDWSQFDSYKDSYGKPIPTPQSSAIWRLNYFMPETGLLLFKRAKWFELLDNKGQKAHLLPGSRDSGPLILAPPGRPKIPLRLDWARLVLFEWGKKSIPFAKNGMLAIKMQFEKCCHPPSLSHLLWLNEAFRYYKLPFYVHCDSYQRHAVIKGLPGPTETEDRTASYWSMWEAFLRLPLTDEKGETWRLAKDNWYNIAAKNAMVGRPAEKKTEGSGESKTPSPAKSPEPQATLALPPFNSLSESLHSKDRTWDIYPDNRAFVWTCAKLASAEKLPYLEPNWLASKHVGAYDQAIIDTWHALLDVDRSSDKVDAFRYDWLQERTYLRWVSNGCYYGFNNFSAALYGNPEDFITKHFETFYLDMGLLLLQVRTSLFRLSRQLSDETQVRLEKGGRQWEKEFRNLRENFSHFVNLYQFPLLSTQQQAIEMYGRMRKWLDVDDLFAEIKSEIEATHEIAALISDKQNERALTMITVGGLAIALGGLVGQVFGMSNILGDLIVHDPHSFWRQTIWVAGGMGSGLLLSVPLLWWAKRTNT